MNKVFLIGNLAKDPELRVTNNGVSVCNMTIAVNRDHSDEAGNKVADFFNIKVWREAGVNCSKYLKKGSKLAVTGSIQNRSYEDQYGNIRYVTEIMAQNVEFLSYNEEKQDDGNDTETVELEPIKEEPVIEEPPVVETKNKKKAKK